MKLYKAYNSDIFNQEDVLVMFASDPDEVMEQVKASDLQNTKDYIMDDLSINEVLEEFGEDKSQALHYIGTGDIDGLASAYWDKVYRKEWTIIDGYPDSKFVYAVYPADLREHEDVELIFSNEEMTEDEIFNELASRESSLGGFRDYVSAREVNMSFNEKFYCDNNGWIFDFAPPLKLRQDLREKIGIEELDVSTFIDELWHREVDDFFEDAPKFKTEFKRYIDGKTDDLSDQFYVYVCKELMKSGEWTTYKIQKLERPV